MKGGGRGRRGFSMELGAKEHLKRFSILDGSGNRVLIEGFLGELVDVLLVEGLMLEVRGSSGVLRVDVSEEELRQALARVRAEGG